MKLVSIKILLFLLIFNLHAQVDNEFKDSFLEAQSYFLFEEYEEALPIYIRLLRQNPYNNNLKYLLGRCLLHDNYRAQQAIGYLEESVKDISSDYKETYKETRAPFDALFYLAEAYHKNNMLDKAVQQYEKFLLIMDKKEYDEKLVQKRIESCKYANKLIADPIPFEPKNIGESINTGFEESNAVISGDGKTLAFTRELQFYDGIFICYKTQNGWTEPLNIIPNLGVDGGVSTSSLSYYGNRLYLYNVDGYDGNIYLSEKNEDGTWSNIKKLNNYINTKYWESNAYESFDGSTLYFSSNRPGGYGRLDLYMSYRSSGSDWGPAVNLGNFVNSEYNDDAPVIINNGNTMIFSSYGHETMGDYDLFYSIKKDGVWSKPLNMGYPLNSTREELDFSALNDGSMGIVCLYQDESIGLKDIYQFDLKISLPELISTNQLEQNPVTESIQKQRDTFSIALKDILSSKDKTDNSPNKTENEEDEVINSHHKESENAALRNNTPALVIPQKEYVITENAELRIPIQVNGDTKLKVKVLNDNNVLLEQTYDIQEKNFIFRYQPTEGESIIVFESTDIQGNKFRETVKVYFSPASLINENIELAGTLSNQEIISMKSLLDRLKKFMENKELITLIDSLNINFLGQKNLIQFLIENIVSADSSFSEKNFILNDLLTALLRSTGLENLNINDFYNLLLQNAPDNIIEFITGLEINEKGFNPKNILEKIIESEPYESYSMEDIYEMLSNLILNYGSEDSAFKSSDIFDPKKDDGSRSFKGLILFTAIGVTFILLLLVFFRKKKKEK